jgi:hypothetical protein
MLPEGKRGQGFKGPSDTQKNKKDFTKLSLEPLIPGILESSSELKRRRNLIII